jgi:hypothetical protein
VTGDALTVLHSGQRLGCLTPTGRRAATSDTDDDRDDET